MSSVAERPVEDIFSALGNKTRLSVVKKLSRGTALSATWLSDGEDVTRQNITKHLQVLEAAGLIKREKRGREVLYALEAEQFEDAHMFLTDVSAGWDRAINRLQQLVEEPSTEDTL